VPAGTVLDAVAPASRFTLTEPGGRVVKPHPAFGFAPAFTVTRPATVTVSFSESAAHVLEVVLEVVLWVIALAAVAGRRRWLDWWWGRRRRAERPSRVTNAEHPDGPRPDELGSRRPPAPGRADVMPSRPVVSAALPPSSGAHATTSAGPSPPPGESQ
jgi:hypothetical protein